VEPAPQCSTVRISQTLFLHKLAPPAVYKENFAMRSITIVAGLVLGAALSAAGQPNTTLEGPSGDVAVTYEWLHSNTQPGQCGCFSFNETGLSSSWRFSSKYAAVIQGDAGFASSGPGTGSTMTLVSGVGGIRYSLPSLFRSGRAPRFFAEVLAGGGHAGGGIAGAGDGSYGFVGRIGGGFDQSIAERFALRLTADYVPTTFANGVNDHQNNVLIGAGLVYRWSRLR
jgi:outer membrane immunogenic protein